MSTPAAAAAATAAPKNAWCSGCHARVDKTSICSGCGIAFYCSRDCQVQDLKSHKIMCKPIILYKLADLPPILLRGASYDRVGKWTSTLSVRQQSTKEERQAVLKDLCSCLPYIPPDAVARLGLLPGLTHTLREHHSTDEASVLLTLTILSKCLAEPVGKIPSILFYLCGGVQALADLVFLRTPQKEAFEGQVDLLQAMALSGLVSALMASERHDIVSVTLGKYGAPKEVLVPRLLMLMQPPTSSPPSPGSSGGGAGGGCGEGLLTEEERFYEQRTAILKQHQEATNLLTLCLTLEAEAPLEMWQKGFDVILNLTRYYLTPKEGPDHISSLSLGHQIMFEGVLDASNPTRSTPTISHFMQAACTHLRFLLADLLTLLQGFIDHFVGATDLLLPLGLPEVLSSILAFRADPEVTKKVLLVSRLSLVYAGGIESVNALVGFQESKLVEEGLKTVEGAVTTFLGLENEEEGGEKEKKKKSKKTPAQDEETRQKVEISLLLVKGGLALVADCMRADPMLLVAHLPRLDALLSMLLLHNTTTTSASISTIHDLHWQPYTEALDCLLAAVAYLPFPLVKPLLMPRIGHLLEILLTATNLRSSSPPSHLSFAILKIFSYLAAKMGEEEEEEEDETGEGGPVSLRVAQALVHLIVNEGGEDTDPLLLKRAVLVLQEWVWAHSSQLLPLLRGDKALRDCLSKLKEEDVAFEYLATVLDAADAAGDDEESLSRLLTTTPIKTTSWVEHLGLEQSLYRTIICEENFAFLKMRKETTCTASGKAFGLGDHVARPHKCRHWYLEKELRKLCSLEEEKEEEGRECVYERFWGGGEKEGGKKCACVKCHRNLHIEVRD